MVIATVPSLRRTRTGIQMGGQLISTEHQVLLLSTHKDAKIHISLRTRQYPYHYEGTIEIPYGGCYICTCEWENNCEMQLKVGATGYEEDMSYQLKCVDSKWVIILMPPLKANGQGGVASLQNLCYANILLAGFTPQQIAAFGLPYVLAMGCMVTPKVHVGLRDPLGNRKMTCNNIGHVWGRLS
jgi:hypothetical protein